MEGRGCDEEEVCVYVTREWCVISIFLSLTRRTFCLHPSTPSFNHYHSYQWPSHCCTYMKGTAASQIFEPASSPVSHAPSRLLLRSMTGAHAC